MDVTDIFNIAGIGCSQLDQATFIIGNSISASVTAFSIQGSSGLGRDVPIHCGQLNQTAFARCRIVDTTGVNESSQRYPSNDSSIRCVHRHIAAVLVRCVACRSDVTVKGAGNITSRINIHRPATRHNRLVDGHVFFCVENDSDWLRQFGRRADEITCLDVTDVLNIAGIDCG